MQERFTPQNSLPNSQVKGTELKQITIDYERHNSDTSNTIPAGNMPTLEPLKIPAVNPIDNSIGFEDILNEAEKHLRPFQPIKHNEILTRLLEQIERVNFRELAELEEGEKLRNKHLLVICIEQILQIALQNNWGMCKHQAFIYLYNRAYWNLFDDAELKTFLGTAAEQLGIDKFDAKFYSFQDQLFKQFIAAANLPKPEQPSETVLLNCNNGTLEICPNSQELRPPDRNDFIKYQLPFDFNPAATAPIFTGYLCRVLPDIAMQNILAEYLAYLFIKRGTLNLEKALLLYGTGANGKSVFFDIVYALLGGDKNVSCYSLQSLTNETGYFRAMLANKLLNYASEINGKLETATFKQLVSGEPVEARLPYHDPFTLTDYAKFIFNCNELPKDAEQTNAYFRRFLIVPFEVTIPEDKQDKQLAQKIIKAELSGVFNWVLDGLKRLLEQKNFTNSDAVTRQLENYKLQSDSVQMFLSEEGFEKSLEDYTQFKELFSLYRTYCNESGYHSCSKRTFGERLRNAGFVVDKKNFGMVVYVKKESF